MTFFTESNKTLGGPSTCSYDSIGMPSMAKNTDMKALITSQGRNNKTTTPAFGHLFNNQ